MKTKNYLVKSLYRVRDPNWMVHDRSHETDLYENYLEMHRISVGSFTRHLKGDWELKFFTGQVNNISEAFEKTFWNIHTLWHQEPCNILYTDPDTVARLDLDIWSLNQFRMFNFTDPRSLDRDNCYNARFDWFFNAGVRYFPHAMNPDVWKLGADMARSWDHSTYDTEQIILNAMLWSQGLRLDQALMPKVAYQAMNLDRAPVWWHDVWNGCSMSQAAIIHVHGSRDSQSRVDIMKKLAA
jgi:hypothetical protein